MEIKKICLLSNGILKEEYNIPTVNEGIQEGRILVFCKDCKYWDKGLIKDRDSNVRMYCYRGTWSEYFAHEMDADDFCSRGERRGEEK